MRDFTGEMLIGAEMMESSKLRMTIAASSLAVTDDISDKDPQEMERPMLKDVLDVTAYPQKDYACSKLAASRSGEGQYSDELHGELTLESPATRGCRRG